MKTSSCKAKGRRLSSEVKDLFHLFARDLQDGDIVVTPSGVQGPDLHLSPEAKKVYPFAIECKNQESIQIWKALQQAESHAKTGDYPILFFRRNRSKVYVSMDAEHFLKLVT